MYITGYADPATCPDRVVDLIISGYEPCIIVTRAPSVFLRYTELKDKKILIHSVITGFGGTEMEPGVNDPKTELEAYREWTSILGPERSILRIDPIFLFLKDNPARIPIKFYQDHKMNTRVRISFAKWYNPKSLKKMGMLEPLHGIHYELDGRLQAYYKIQDMIGRDVELCREPDIPSIGCVSERDYNVLGMDAPVKFEYKHDSFCTCLGSKRQLLPPMECKFHCLYCKDRWGIV